MNKTQTLKYWRISENKQSIILLPSKVGIDIIKKTLESASIPYKETIEKIDKSNLLAIQIDFRSGIRYFKYDFGLGGIVNIYVFTEEEKKFYIIFPFEV